MPNVTVNTRTRRASVVTAASAPVPIVLDAEDVNIDDLQDVDVSAIPEPYPGNLNFSLDQRYTLVYDPAQGKWVAALEAVVSEIDGGIY